MSSGSVVQVEDHAAVRLIRLNRPEVLNALDVEMVSTLTEQLSDAAHGSAVRTVVVTGAGRAFCAGADRRTNVEFDDRPGARARWLAALQDLSAVIWAAPKPVIAAVNGYVVGGGFELALACDLIVAGEDASFVLPEVGLGVAMTGGGAFTLPAQIGLSCSKWLLYTGEPLKAEKAYALGLVAKLVAGRAEPIALELATKLAGNDPEAQAVAKQALQFGAESGMAASLQREHALACARPALPRMGGEARRGRR